MAQVLSLSHSGDTAGSFLFPPSCCSAGSCQLIVVALLKPFSLSWVGAVCSAPLLECSSVFRMHSPSSVISIPSSLPSCSLLSLIPCFGVPHSTGTENWGLCVFSSSYPLAPCEEPGPCPLTPPWVLLEVLWVSPQAPLSEGGGALLHRDSAAIAASLMDCSGLAALLPASLSATLPGVAPQALSRGGETLPAFSRGQAAAALSCRSTLLARALLTVCCQEGPLLFSGNCWAQPPQCLPT